MLSPLQEQVAEIIAGLAEAEGFALAGGAALIVRGDVRRQTRDLDFFGLTADAVDRLVPAVDRALQDGGSTERGMKVYQPGNTRIFRRVDDVNRPFDVCARVLQPVGGILVGGRRMDDVARLEACK